MFAPKTILVPTDFSEFSDRALGDALDIAKKHEARVILLHVVGLVQQCSVDYCLNGEAIENIRNQAVQSAREQMQQEIGRVVPGGGGEISVDVREGVPYQEILKEQEARKADLIVIASHGRTGLLGHLGSVADKVARGAGCPVLIVKQR